MATSSKLKIFILMFIYSISLTSCINQFNWKKISAASFRTIYDSDTNSVFLFDTHDSLIYKKNLEENVEIKPNDIIEIQPPNAVNITSLCTFNGIWVTGFASISVPTPLFNAPEPLVPNIIYYSSKATQEWTQIETSDQLIRCKVLNKKAIVFWTDNKVYLFDQELNKKTYHTNWRIEDVTIDKESNLWVATSSGEVYMHSKEDWNLIDVLITDSNLNIFIDKNNSLWVASNNQYLYHYSSDFKKETVFTGDLGWTQEFFEDKDGGLWLSTNSKLFLQKRDEFSELPLPYNTSIITSSFFTNDNHLMISTEDGLFYLDIRDDI